MKKIFMILIIIFLFSGCVLETYIEIKEKNNLIIITHRYKDDESIRSSETVVKNKISKITQSNSYIYIYTSEDEYMSLYCLEDQEKIYNQLLQILENERE